MAPGSGGRDREQGPVKAMKHWFAVHTRPRQEALAEEHLRRQCYEVYCPRIRQQRRSRGRWRQSTEPLFPRYLFVHLTPGQDNFSPVRYSTGVRDFIRFGGTPGRVPEVLIDEIRRHEDRELGVHVAREQWQRGDAIEIVAGPFAGSRGIFTAASGAERVVILLTLLGRENRIVVPRDAIVPAA
jgi:transcriptional antiterminator RfaH